jgi:hypothetical protein
MKILKLILCWIIIIVTMILSWSIGSFVGNAITGSNPPPPADPFALVIAFLWVCVVNSFLVTLMIWATRQYSGWMKWSALILYLFAIQFFLTQMETYFFSGSFAISSEQIVSILVSGFLVSSITAGIGIYVFKKLYQNMEGRPLRLEIKNARTFIPSVIFMACIVYPMVYMTFGYYIAWQNENLRMFYAGSTQINPFFTQLAQSFSDGVFFFQMLRGLIWLLVSVPIVVMLRHMKIFQYLLVGLFSALLPASLLFIPNPYMPGDIALSHFYETSTSNFLWGVVVTYGVNLHAGAVESLKLKVK